LGAGGKRGRADSGWTESELLGDRDREDLEEAIFFQFMEKWLTTLCSFQYSNHFNEGYHVSVTPVVSSMESIASKFCGGEKGCQNAYSSSFAPTISENTLVLQLISLHFIAFHCMSTEDPH